MPLDIQQELAALTRLTVKELRVRYATLFGEASRSGNKAWLNKRITWRLQVLAEGDLSERARRRAAVLAHDADLRLSPPRPSSPTSETGASVSLPGRRDDRLPPPGAILTRPYKGGILHVKVLADGFEFGGKVYRSLSAVAKEITGSHCSGFLFFRLKPGARR